MRWLNPLAWSGLVMLVLPLLVHLLSRQPPRVVVFPSLRFLMASPLRPTRRAQVSDWWLLLVRCAIVIAAVAALAQPAPQPAPSAATALSNSGSPAARVVIVDTTARSDSVGAATASDDVGTTLVLRRDALSLRSALTEAVAWLRAAPAPRALMVQSAFPTFALDSVDVAMVPADIALSLNARPSRPLRTQPVTAADTLDWITALDSSAIARVQRAVRDGGGDVVRPVREVTRFTTVITTNRLAPGLEAAATPSTASAAAWERLQAVARNDLLEQMMAATADSGTIVAGTPLHFSAPGGPAGTAAISGLVRESGPGPLAVIVAHVRERPALAAALLLAASSRQRGTPSSLGVVQPDAYRDSTTLRRWSDLPSAPPIGAGPAADRNTLPTYTRYVWLLVLLLLAVEHVMRSRCITDSTPVDKP